MTKDVLISLRGLQFGQSEADEADADRTGGAGMGRTEGAGMGSAESAHPGNVTDTIETTATGTYYKKNRSSYVLYEEPVEGFREPVKNKIKFGEHFLELVKSGPVNVRMVFEENKKNMANYNTPYGNIVVGTDTKKIHVTEEADRITVQVDYVLEMNHEYLADCKILMDIHSQNNI